ncbi:hypothetical protein DICVIV_14022 [Dictyocaulus viviparus]|uniref:Histidine acid phosphatase n=1 Tax=Dictyocaulus viviparus TaxID=29172 RepID=A0A0D8X6D1_DICVI|nr:hypothetical protein DICVIV_14022 [Dictyocaulus viviparus]
MSWKLSILCTLTAIYLFGRCPSSTARELVFVQAIWRHGDRAPTSLPYPKDPYDEIVWPRGFKQLTNEGIRQMHELGTYFRRRYGEFISSHYDSNQVFLQLLHYCHEHFHPFCKCSSMKLSSEAI